MNEAEIAEIVAVYWDIAVNSFTVYITFTFAFLATAYFVGASLTRFQALAASSMYVFSAVSGILSMTAAIQAWSVYKASAPTRLEEVYLLSDTLWQVYMPVLTSAAAVISLYFMYDLRRRAGIALES